VESPPSDCRLRIEPLSSIRASLEQPLTENRLFRQDSSLEGRSWLDFLVLRNMIAREINQNRSAEHIVVSFSITNASFVAQHAALELSLKHIASVRGSDFSLGIRSPSGMSVFAFVMSNASFIVTVNEEQLRFVSSVFGVGARARCIHNSLCKLPALRRPALLREVKTEVRLFADCGYSFRKGTHVLLDAFEKIATGDELVHLTLVGGSPVDEQGSKAYWLSRTQRLTQLIPEKCRLFGSVDGASVQDYLQTSDIYCSASFSEGCSNARIAALSAGIPIVSTCTGELVDVALNADHVLLAQPGDSEEFGELLFQACLRRRLCQLQPNSERIERWRSYFNPEREATEWLEVLNGI
jgi:glycosyltransferase involved in cell wall biosynthesis